MVKTRLTTVYFRLCFRQSTPVSRLCVNSIRNYFHLIEQPIDGF